VLVIAERINATRKRIRKAVLDRDADRIGREARRQHEAGGDYIDANAGIDADHEPERLAWLVETIQAAVECPVSLDSAHADAIAAGLEVHKGTAMVNSVTAEEGRHEAVLPLVKDYGALVIALTIGTAGMPTGVEDRLEAAKEVADRIAKHEIPMERVYFDPMVCAVATSSDAGRIVLETVRRLREAYPESHVTCGLSNVSFGLPQRRLLNRTFLPMLMSMGLDSAIMDPTEPGMMATIFAAEAALGADEFCMNYISAERAGTLS
jgi:5-methyltetrahydrofolate--homocysteine methyltransferase